MHVQCSRLSPLAVLLLALVLAACGSGPDSSSPPAGAAPTSVAGVMAANGCPTAFQEVLGLQEIFVRGHGLLPQVLKAGDDPRYVYEVPGTGGQPIIVSLVPGVPSPDRSCGFTVGTYDVTGRYVPVIASDQVRYVTPTGEPVKLPTPQHWGAGSRPPTFTRDDANGQTIVTLVVEYVYK